ncbi:MAG: GTPase HflX [Clostridia bacterium]|nr:GTPase HflX [Clostridia bacterium]MDY6183913.1 GTPase HflX [Eubacteriales bacterium]
MEAETIQKTIIVTIAKSQRDMSDAETGLDELTRLVETAGGEVVARVIQLKTAMDPRTCIGAGKVHEIKELGTNLSAELVVFDFELTPSQIRNLEDDFDGMEVIDRTILILDIFAKHAVTGEGKLQVELAQLKYTVPRLVGRGKALSRLGGGIGTRGPGESQLESDRRHVHERICALERQLKELESTRKTMRAARDRSGIRKVALVGYTNAGKSTLMNALTDAGVLAENKLFATLDPTTRRLTLQNGEEVLITDTVGFIRNLPHHLVHAFRSTLDEVVYADIILLVSDVTDPETDTHIAVTEELLGELGASDKPILYVYNQCDKLSDFPKTGLRKENNQIYISAEKKFGLNLLLESLAQVLDDGKERHALLIPYDSLSKVSALHDDATVEEEIYSEEGVRITATLDKKSAGKYAEYFAE